ncbi:multiheme c-type cytochrome [Aliiglaciecola sp. NS0011-25]|uniref:multiheme c-type cytochrome n=1 Tax=Aliiglaciecola sp. NS0011-25 TaxID=3127654 RepID=UPI00310B1A9A
MNIRFSFYTLLLFYTVVTSLHARDSLQFLKSSSNSNQACVGCHQKSYQQWLKSDHAKSMALANNQNVLADFNNKYVEHYGQKAKFYRRGELYFVDIAYDDKKQTLPIKFTFGHYPLQQYLVEIEQGRLQVLPFAWDSRPIEEGGQRWYHNYSKEEIKPNDRLHWRQPLQNWNGMCADCHSDGLQRNYDVGKNQFNSQFDNINIGCLSCHGNMTEHAAQEKNVKRDVVADITSTKHPTGQWLRGINDKVASWQGLPRDNSFMDTCFSCHALRAPLGDGINAQKPFLDQFTPQLIAAPIYHVDGQIQEEVYVYGSFLQSKMYRAGVNCLDCHDKHTMKIKVEGNGLCLQCHSAQEYQANSHHQHQENSTGSQCVNCHMPDNRYMGVDDRRDHSFRVPRPNVSIEFNTPNACTKCHDDKTNQWANKKLNQWHGKPQNILPTKHLMMRLNSGQPITLQQHLSIVADTRLDVITRASALQQLPYSTNQLSASYLSAYLTHNEALLRLSAAIVSTLLSSTEKEVYLTPLLNDDYRAIRVAAVRNLLSIKISHKYMEAFQSAFKELTLAQKVNSWRGEGIVNQAVRSMDIHDIGSAEKQLKRAMDVDPYFDASYVNLADLYRAQQRPLLTYTVLQKGLINIPNSSGLNYSMGLHFVREKKLDKAIKYFEQAIKFSPDNSQYAYTYILAIDGLGDSKEALSSLEKLIVSYSDKTQLKELGLYLSQKLQNRESYQ